MVIGPFSEELCSNTQSIAAGSFQQILTYSTLNSIHLNHQLAIHRYEPVRVFDNPTFPHEQQITGAGVTGQGLGAHHVLIT